jgi:hypothetical protein
LGSANFVIVTNSKMVLRGLQEEVEDWGEEVIIIIIIKRLLVVLGCWVWEERGKHGYCYRYYILGYGWFI